MDVDRIMRRYASGESAAFDEIYAAIGPRIYSFCVRLAGKTSEADDLYQETFLKLHRSRASYVPGTNVVHWTFAIARSTYLDRVRKRSTRPEDLLAASDASLDAFATDHGSPEAAAGARALAELVEAELLRMSEANRTAYVLLKLEGLSAAEAAQILGTTSDAVKQRAHRVYEALRAALVRAGWAEAAHA